MNLQPSRSKEEVPMANAARNHRDNVFCILYSDRRNLLSLYNAVNGTNYRNEEELTVVTLDYAICVRMKNDAAFVIDSRLNLYEQQSTVNPNMPLRSLYYVAEELKGLMPMSRLYGKTRVKIPEPRFIVFYNGTEEQPAERILRLSDLYESFSGKPELELAVRQINLGGCNPGFLEKCESLRGYVIFVNKVRAKREAGEDVEAAVTEAVDECIRENVLRDFFKLHRNEVVDVGIYEFDAELYERVIKEESREEGRAEGRAEAILELLEDLGVISDSLRQRILEQKDQDVLKRWHKLSARAENLESFEMAIQESG